MTLNAQPLSTATIANALPTCRSMPLASLRLTSAPPLYNVDPLNTVSRNEHLANNAIRTQIAKVITAREVARLYKRALVTLALIVQWTQFISLLNSGATVTPLLLSAPLVKLEASYALLLKNAYRKCA